MSDFSTMLLVLGGSAIVAAALLYLSLLPSSPRTVRSERRAAGVTTGIMAAASDRSDRPDG